MQFFKKLIDHILLGLNGHSFKSLELIRFFIKGERDIKIVMVVRSYGICFDITRG